MATKEEVKTASINVEGVQAPTNNINKLQAQNNQMVQTLDARRRELQKYYNTEERVIVMGSPAYQKFFGRTMAISINGVAIFVPLDGQQYKIPKTYAEVFMTRLADVDETIRLRKSLANIQQNNEAYAGERGLVMRA